MLIPVSSNTSLWAAVAKFSPEGKQTFFFSIGLLKDSHYSITWIDETTWKFPGRLCVVFLLNDEDLFVFVDHHGTHSYGGVGKVGHLAGLVDRQPFEQDAQLCVGVMKGKSVL